MADEGVIVERRTVLELGAVAGALLWLGAPRQAADDEGFAGFTKRWRELAGRFLGDELAADAYLYALIGAAARVGPEGFPDMQRAVYEADGLRTGPAWFGDRIFAIQLRLEPGARIQAHNHPAHNVVTVGIRGDCRYRHFEPVGEPPPMEDRETAFRVRTTRSGVLVPGGWTELSRHRHNAHDFVAGPDGATILDLTTEPGGAKFSKLEIGDEVQDPFERTRATRWAGRDF